MRPHHPLGGIRVVLVEDDADTLEVLAHVLRHHGAAVTTAATAEDALLALEAADVVVTDVAMPGHDGVWLLEQVNRGGRPVPVIAISGFSERQFERLAGAPFARKFLKPVDVWRLSREILAVVTTG